MTVTRVSRTKRSSDCAVGTLEFEFKEPCSPGRGLLLFSSTLRNKKGDMPRENCQIVPVTL